MQVFITGLIVCEGGLKGFEGRFDGSKMAQRC